MLSEDAVSGIENEYGGFEYVQRHCEVSRSQRNMCAWLHGDVGDVFNGGDCGSAVGRLRHSAFSLHPDNIDKNLNFNNCFPN
jgi:hypothetical protein